MSQLVNLETLIGCVGINSSHHILAMASHISDADNDSETMSIQVSKGGNTFTTILPQRAILSDLISSCEDAGTWATDDTHLDWDRAKFIAKGQMLRSGVDDEKPIAHLGGKKVTLQVPTVEDLQSLQQSSEAAKARQARREAQRSRAAVPWSRRQQGVAGGEEYTFERIEPLPGLRNPERSRDFLKRLADDPGIRAAMRKHKFKGMHVLAHGSLFVTVREPHGLMAHRPSGESTDLRQA